jgi:hypothetical protein
LFPFDVIIIFKFLINLQKAVKFGAGSMAQVCLASTKPCIHFPVSQKRKKRNKILTTWMIPENMTYETTETQKDKQ